MRAGDGTHYTGIARNIQKRLTAHRSGKGSRYLRGRGPLKIVYRETISGQSSALKREASIKRLSRARKLALAGKSRL